MDYRVWPLGWLKWRESLDGLGEFETFKVHYTPYPEYNYHFWYDSCNGMRLGYYAGYYFSSLRRKICETWRTIRLPRRGNILFVNPSG